MKRLFFLLITICISLFLFLSKETYGLEKNVIFLENFNSNHLSAFIKENHLNVSKLCTTDFCDYIRGQSIDESLKIFNQKYEQYLKTKTTEEIAKSTILKGYPITKIYLLY